MRQGTWIVVLALGCVATTERELPRGDEAPDDEVPDDAIPRPPSDDSAAPVQDTAPDAVPTGSDVDSAGGDTGDTAAPPLVWPAGRGRFVDLTADLWDPLAWEVPPDPPENGIGWPKQTTAQWGDVDGDGQPELVTADVFPVSGGRRIQVFHPDGQGGWTHDADLSATLAEESPASIVGFVDLDGDGTEDLVRATASDEAVWFVDGGTRTPAEVHPPASGALFAHGVAALGDLDQDGWIDLLLGRGGCGASIGAAVAVRTAPRAWTVMPDMLAGSTPGHPYTLLVAPLDHADPALVWVGESCDHRTPHPGFHAATASTASGRPRYDATTLVDPSSYVHTRPSGPGGAFTHAQPMGATVVDLDRDGWLDLGVAMADPLFMWWRGTGAYPMADGTLDRRLPIVQGPATAEQLPWGVVPLDADRDGWTDIAMAHGDDATQWLAGSPNAPYHPTLTWNRGSAGFDDISDEVGLTDVLGDGKALVTRDLDGDLDADLIQGSFGGYPRLLRNDLVVPGRPLVIDLAGTTSNHLGLGAIVRVDAPGVPPQVHLMGGSASPNGLSEPALFLGVGQATEVDLTITWPSGLVHEVPAVSTGQRVRIEEPFTLRLDTVTRHVPADGVSTVEVRVQPRRSDGSADPGASVTVDLWHGTGTWAGPLARDGDGWVRTLVAPSSSGEAVIEAVIDGVPVRTHPRVWWDAPEPDTRRGTE